MHRDEVVAQRSWMDDDGVVHEYDEALTGEAMSGGPVMLTWADVRDAAEGADWGYNVVIHEFAHVLDMADGTADGVPPLPDLTARESWIEVIDTAYEAFCDLVDSGVETVLDPYGAEAPEEFFAVAVEAFFVTSAPSSGSRQRCMRCWQATSGRIRRRASQQIERTRHPRRSACPFWSPPCRWKKGPATRVAGPLP
jgi:Mlc titration factor MtfA (ptsG expression regulator)